MEKCILINIPCYYSLGKTSSPGETHEINYTCNKPQQ